MFQMDLHLKTKQIININTEQLERDDQLTIFHRPIIGLIKQLSATAFKTSAYLFYYTEKQHTITYKKSNISIVGSFKSVGHVIVAMVIELQSFRDAMQFGGCRPVDPRQTVG